MESAEHSVEACHTGTGSEAAEIVAGLRRIRSRIKLGEVGISIAIGVGSSRGIEGFADFDMVGDTVAVGIERAAVGELEPHLGKRAFNASSNRNRVGKDIRIVGEMRRIFRIVKCPVACGKSIESVVNALRGVRSSGGEFGVAG